MKFWIKMIVCFGAIIAVLAIGSDVLKDYLRKQEWQKFQYEELVGKELQSEWECLPDSELAREQFILKIMQRFSPGDYELFELGKAWMLEYSQKMTAGTLTVEDRKNAKDSFLPVELGNSEKYYLLPWAVNYGRPSKNLSIAACALNDTSKCVSLNSFLLKESGFAQVLFQKHGLRWLVTEEQFWKFVSTEYLNIKDKSERIAELNELTVRNNELRYKAQQNVNKMRAVDVSPSMEESAYRQEYLKLKCH